MASTWRAASFDLAHERHGFFSVSRLCGDEWNAYHATHGDVTRLGSFPSMEAAQAACAARIALCDALAALTADAKACSNGFASEQLEAACRGGAL